LINFPLACYVSLMFEKQYLFRHLFGRGNDGKSIWHPNSFLALLAILFIGICGWQYATRLEGIAQYHEVRPSVLSEPIAGSRSLDYQFTARSSVLGRIYLFANREQLRRSKKEEILIELIDAASLEVIEKEMTRVSDVTFVLRDSLVFSPGWRLEPGKRYRLRISLPATPADQGLSFLLSQAPKDSSDLCWIGGRLQRGLVPDHLILGEKPAFPVWAVALAGFLLVLAALTSRRNMLWYVLLVTAGAALVLSEYSWERALWVFWGEYWPDGYVFMARGIQEQWSGLSSAGDVLRFLEGQRSGCNFVIPILLAGLNSTGLSYIFSYTLLSLAFSIGTILLVTAWISRNWRLQETQAAFLVVLVGLNVVVIRGFARPVTDAGGMFFTALFVTAFTATLRDNNGSRFAGVIAALAIWLGIHTRMALFPLLVVPVVFVVWMRVFPGSERKVFPWKRPLAIFSAAALLLGASLAGSGLLKSVAATAAFAALEEFRSRVSLGAYVKQSLIALQLALPLGLLRIRQFLVDVRLTIPLLTILGFQATLLIGRIIPWLRYWAPVAPLACGIACVLLFEGKQGVRKWEMAVMVIVIAGNLAVVALQAGY
jgi:hypothetical protein